jgi:hypothetical protein
MEIFLSIINLLRVDMFYETKTIKTPSSSEAFAKPQ